MGNEHNANTDQSMFLQTGQEPNYGKDCSICGKKLSSISNEQRCMTWLSTKSYLL